VDATAVRALSKPERRFLTAWVQTPDRKVWFKRATGTKKSLKYFSIWNEYTRLIAEGNSKNEAVKKAAVNLDCSIDTVKRAIK
jgi:hypothetical protein